MNVAKFLRTSILKNISERLLLKISTSETNLLVIPEFYYPCKPFRILKFALREWFCYVTCFFFYQGFLLGTLTTHRADGEGRGASFIPL